MTKRTFYTPDNQITAEIARNIDWSKHPLGPVENWPVCLRINLNTLFNTRQAVCLFWGEECFYFYNDAYIPIVGENKHPWAMGKPGAEVWKEVWDLLYPQIQEVMKTGTASWNVDQVVPILRAGKSQEAYFTYSYSPVIGDDGKIVGTIVICVETTDRTNAEHALKNSNQRFRQILMQMPAAVAFLESPDLVYTLANDRYKELIGKGDFILNKPLRKAIPELEEETHKIFEDVYNEGKTFVATDFKATLVRNGKKEFGYFNFVSERILDEHGKSAGIVIVAIEVTEQVKNRKSLEDVNRKLEGVVHNMSEGLIIANPQGEMLLWNPSALELHGFSDLNDVLKNITEFTKLFRLDRLDGTELPFNDWPMVRLLRGETFSEYEVKLTRRDTGAIWFASYSGSPIYDTEGNMSLALLTVRDVSKKYYTEADLKKAINARDEFMSVASHELKTPLTSLKLTTQSAKRRLSMPERFKVSPAEMVKILTQNEGQINRLVRLVDDMLDLTRVQSGRLHYLFNEANLCEILTEVCERLQEQFEHANISLDVKCQKDLYSMVDRDRIEQVITNLLTNALKYGNQMPVTVCLESHHDKAHIKVQDHGMGISPENKEIIFDRFQRLVSPNEISGLGIGLYVTKEIVEAHHGKIWVESQPHKGSTFHVELPINHH